MWQSHHNPEKTGQPLQPSTTMMNASEISDKTTTISNSSMFNGSQSHSIRKTGSPDKESYNRGNARVSSQPPSYQHHARPHMQGSHHSHPPPHASQPPMSHGPPPPPHDVYHEQQNCYYPPHHDGYHHHHPPPLPPPHSRPYHHPPHYPPHHHPEYHDPSHHSVPPPHYQEAAPRAHQELRHAGGCTCKKSKCLKLYCQCFASSTTCGPKCKCQTCHNTTLHGSAIEEARRVILERNPSAFEDKFVSSGPPPPPPFRSYPSPPRTLQQPHYAYPPPRSWQQAPPPPPPLGSPHHPSHNIQHDTSSPRRSEVPPHVVVKNPPSPTSASLKSNVSSTTSSSSSNDDSSKRKGCKCRRSHCLKKYCDCFHSGNKCGNDCRCYNCKNQPDPTGNNNAGPEEGAPVKEVVVPTPCKDQGVTEVKKSDESVSSAASHEDRMAIMAAVAMTELFSGVKKPDVNDKPPVVSRTDSDDMSQPLPLKKRKVSTSEFSVVDEKKRKLNTASPTPSTYIETKHIVSSNSSQASASPVLKSNIDSRDQSPVSTMPHPPMYMQQQHHYKPRFVPPPPYYCQPRYTGGHPPLLSKHRGSPGRSVCSDQSSTNNTRSSKLSSNGVNSLPKSLSYRKICSTCGKTRGEHGELGFGNKCVYQDCGRCGAGIHMHVKANVPMGFNCTLCVAQGATPGASEAYERKIQALAERADIQKELNLQQKQQQLKVQ